MKHTEAKHPLQQSILQELLTYNPDTGLFTWKHRNRRWFASDKEFGRWNTRYAEKTALTAKIEGYPMGHIFNKPYKAHRVAFCMTYGYWPECVDHINGVRDDNRLCNLKEANKVENGRNQKKNTRNTSGVTGVYWWKAGGVWRAEIGVSRNKVYLGSFSTKDEAVAARKAAEKMYGFSKRHGT
jgi:hypothetical protein